MNLVATLAVLVATHSTVQESRPEPVVFVFDWASRAPVAGAEVLWIAREPHDSPGEWERRSDLGRLEALMRAEGGHTLTDEHGNASIRVEGRCEFAASVESAWGQAGMPVWNPVTERDEVSIVVYPDAALAVRVVDPRGRPRAGVPVALRRSSGTFRSDELVAITDTLGEASLLHARAFIEREIARYQGSKVQPPVWSAALGLCLAGALEHPIETSAWPSEAIVLTLPETGALEVEVVDSRGQRVQLEQPVALCPAQELPGPGAPWATKLANSVPVGVETTTQRDGLAVFDDVGLGLDVGVLARRNGASATRRFDFRGPTDPGETRCVRLVMDAEHPTLVGKLQHPSGEAFANESFDVELHVAPSPDRRRYVNVLPSEFLGGDVGVLITGANGEFVLDLDTRDPEDAGDRLLVFTHHRNAPDSASVRLDVTALMRPGIHDLGAVSVPSAPVLATGRVVDDAGQPVAGARLVLMRARNEHRYWTSSRADGRFELRGATPYDEFELDVDMEHHGNGWMPGVVPGTTGLEILLPRIAELEGRVLGPRREVLTELTVQLEMSEAQAGGVTRTFSCPVNADGSFEHRGLVPGVYEARVHEGNPAHPIHAQSGIRVVVGELARVSIAVPVATRTLRWRIVDPRGEPVAKGLYVLRPSSTIAPLDIWEAHPLDLEEFEGGLVEVTSPAPAFDLAVYVEGHGLGRFLELDADAELSLEPAIVLRLHVAADLAPEDDDLSWHVTLRPRPYPARFHRLFALDIWSSAFDASGRATLLAPASGEFELAWMLRKRSPGGHAGFGARHSTEITVQDGALEQAFELELPFDPAELERQFGGR